MKKIISYILLMGCVSQFSIALGNTISQNCRYKSEFEQCKEANKKGETRTIHDFICIASTSDEEIMAQIILDKQFQQYDQQANDYLAQLENNKTQYFGKSASHTFLEAIDDIENKFGRYNDDSLGKQYFKSCDVTGADGVVAQTVGCFQDGVSAENVKKYFQEDDCRNLALTKLSINKQVAYDILKLNKNQVKKDERKLYVQKQRNKYDQLLDLIMVNIGYIERIRKKTPSFTKNPKK